MLLKLILGNCQKKTKNKKWKKGKEKRREYFYPNQQLKHTLFLLNCITKRKKMFFYTVRKYISQSETFHCNKLDFIMPLLYL